MAQGTQLLDAVPQPIPAGWLIRRVRVPAKVDVLQEEIPGVQGFGTLQVVPIGESLTASFRFALPAGILESGPGSGQATYHLRVQKQPGTLAVPITFRFHLPNNATIRSIPNGASVQAKNVFLETNLRTDLDLAISFQIP